VNPEEYRVLYEQEDLFWWYRGMRAITATLIDRVIGPVKRGLCLDAGCGTGANLRFLERWHECLGLDLSPEAMSYLGRRGRFKVTLASVEHIPFADDSFDLVTVFEVILCSDNDLDALREMRRVIRPGGHVLIRESAFSLLSGEHDLATGLKGRYASGELEQKMKEAGFRLVWHSYVNFFLFFPILALRIFRRFIASRVKPGGARSDFRFSPRVLNGFLERILRLEALWLRHGTFPFGVSIFAIGSKDQ
jgi:SAM-dependent methyltransferase